LAHTALSQGAAKIAAAIETKTRGGDANHRAIFFG
jgi:hypothetical protein